ncbi:MAG: DUF481 domain-containing protein [Steroidobacteraceae bacterium]
MHKRYAVLAAAVALATVPAAAHAEWKAKAELGGSFATGNSDNQSANAALGLTLKYDQWGHEFGFSGNYGNDGDQTTAQRWEVRAQSNYDFTEKAYWFGAGRYDDDRFSAYDYQASLATGLGYKFFDSEELKFWVQGGPGYRLSKERETGRNVDGLIFRGNLGYEQKFTSNTKLINRFLIEAGSDNTYLQNDLGLEVMMSGSLGLRLAYEVRYNTDVPAGVDHTDTLTTIGLLYETK